MGASLAAVGLVMAMSGCATDPFANQRVAAYVPDVNSAERMPWTPDAAGASVAVPGADEGGEVATPATRGSTEAPVIEAGSDATVAVQSKSAGLGRLLRRGDRLMISLRGIPRPEDVSEVVDDDGHINLPLIGLVKIEGISTAEAEKAIQSAYVSGGFYRDINVIIVAQEDAVFVRGEVTRPGKYPLVGDTTLLMAIAAAGGYTDYANPRKIRVIRGDEVHNLNATRIEARQEDDFLLHPNDIVIVERRIFL